MTLRNGARVRVMTGALAATLVMTLLTWVTAPPAAAAAWNQGGVYLHYDPPSNFGTACVSRTIQLDAGLYRWKRYEVKKGHPNHPSEQTERIRLRSGSYRWQDCLGLHPRQDINAQYIHCTWLDELATSGGPAKRCSPVWVMFGGEHESFATEGFYYYGSALDREGP